MARNPFKTNTQNKPVAPDIERTIREQQQLNGTDKQTEYTGERIAVRGPGYGIKGLKNRIQHG